MIGRLILAALMTLPLASTQVTAIGQETSGETESVKTRPNQQDITSEMTKVGRMTVQQQDSRLSAIMSAKSVSSTPRSDFLFCIGMAYLGNSKAQRCVGNAYEKGLGVVEDITEAYIWYTIALENSAAKPEEKSAEADRERVKTRLVSSYPAPTDDDLEDLVKAQKNHMEQYRLDMKGK